MRMQGRILKALSGLYQVEGKSGVISCRARGSFRLKSFAPMPGDLVEFDEKEKVIEKILPRKNALIRPPLANVDRMFVVIATTNPEPSLVVTDKLLAVCEENGIEPYIIINKTDLKEARTLKAIYELAGFPVFETSLTDSTQLSRIAELIRGHICAFSGNSGVGKSSLLNLLGYQEEVGTVSEKNERGRHTTKRVELFPFMGGYIADTPGFGDVAYEECLKATKKELSSLFREFADFTSDCRFSDCVHINEPDCGVKNALGSGKIAKERYDNYCRIFEECKGIKKDY